MNKQEVLDLIDEHKNSLLNPVEILSWVWLRVTILQIPDSEWDKYATKASEVLSQ